MDNIQNPLRYAGDKDKAYGLAGMAVSLVALDGEEYLAGIYIDREPSEAFALDRVFGLKGNPRMSAKILWEQAVKELRLSASVALGNLVCRRYLLDRKGVGRDETEAIRRAVRQEASQHCELDFDEADRIFDHCLSYADRLFRHSGVQSVATGFADHILSRRSMTASEALELLASLGMR
ncbi:MAG: hypothetical protein K2F63_06025 [Muribaculaceae bacterium]|nr:hypothetical protein [Muribaculaceae bacterium]MDE6135657.1 hypothetical protein [Muribaculaceae bacterium]